MTSLFALQLPDAGYILIGCICIALIGIVGLTVIVRAASSMKKTVVEELRGELGVAKSPLIIKQHEPFASLTQHEELQKQFRDLTEQRRKDVGGLHIKIEQGLDNMRRDISEEFKEVRDSQNSSREEIAVLKNETTNQTRQLSSLDLKMDQVLIRLPRPGP